MENIINSFLNFLKNKFKKKRLVEFVDNYDGTHTVYSTRTGKSIGKTWQKKENGRIIGGGTLYWKNQIKSPLRRKGYLVYFFA